VGGFGWGMEISSFGASKKRRLSANAGRVSTGCRSRCGVGSNNSPLPVQIEYQYLSNQNVNVSHNGHFLLPSHHKRGPITASYRSLFANRNRSKSHSSISFECRFRGDSPSSASCCCSVLWENVARLDLLNQRNVVCVLPVLEATARIFGRWKNVGNTEILSSLWMGRVITKETETAVQSTYNISTWLIVV
jgi:hypothetical protein